MSTVYVLEPPTKGKVVLNTSYGPIDIELWPKEAPKAVRNFVQLCLEGYYDNTIFHRVIKSFLVQGGDPTGTGTGGESIYGGVFPDEFHSRLRFKHRGLVACAGAGSPNSNASQFFMTLDRSDFLDKKHTIFGKVTGDSIYNLVALGEVETGKDDRPVDPPPKILSVEVLWNPFEDIVPRAKPAKALPSGVTIEKKDAKQKATKKLNLLSFGEEAEEEEKELVAVSARIRSSHDVLDDPRLLKDGKHNQAKDSSEGKSTRDVQLTIREALGSRKEASRKESEADFQESLDNSDEDEAFFDARMRQQILKRRKELGDPPPKQKLPSDVPRGNPQIGGGGRALTLQLDTCTRFSMFSTSPTGIHIELPQIRMSDGEHDDDRPKVNKLSLKRKGIGSEARAERMANANTDLQLLSGPERERQLLKQKRRGRKGQEEDVCL
ncbi:hypothetical protein RND71_008283 [Anisodus tanguticus]|uniref:PPIase cyclophilin-type domain-containing protein n=1 Tax=Anisodus tanguticus TaxID=243964 RepID=A0AAE1SLG4_9SOLA|nr:hypothetical protein RND71_008283 [Anisodus tanguticus]